MRQATPEYSYLAGALSYNLYQLNEPPQFSEDSSYLTDSITKQSAGITTSMAWGDYDKYTFCLHQSMPPLDAVRSPLVVTSRLTVPHPP